jgi:Protein of unknown function (DUF3617)
MGSNGGDVKKPILLCSVFLAGSGLWAADTLTPLDVKLGQWESTITSESNGQLPLPQELLDRLSPEQRAKMEERMKSYNAHPKTTVTKSCLKKGDLDKPFDFANNQKTCKPTIITSSRTKQEIRVACNEGGGKQSGTVRIEALSSENVKGTTQMTMSAGDRTMTVNSTFSAKWLGPVCKED